MKIDPQAPQKCTLGPVRFSFMNVFSPRKTDHGEPQYSIVCLIPKKANDFCKDPEAEIEGLKSCIREAAKSDKLKNAKVWANPLKDGDKELNGEGNPRYPGYWYVSAKAFTRDREGNEKLGPVVKDGLGVPISARSGFVSGDWGKVVLYFSAYDTSGNKGVTAYLNAVQCLYKDEPFAKGGGDEFEPVADAYKPTASVGAGEEKAYDPFADE